MVTGNKLRDVFMQLHWLPVRERIKYKVLVFTFKAIHGLAPQYIDELNP
jgi:hypothetical protein